MDKKYVLGLPLFCSLILTGCDSFRNTLGLDHSQPNAWETDEPSPGLMLPPDFAQRPQLPVPNPGAQNPHAISIESKAQKTLLGKDMETEKSTLVSGAVEQDILKKASQDQVVPSDIRTTVDEESQADSTVSQKLIHKIESWKKEAAENLGLSGTKQSESSQ